MVYDLCSRPIKVTSAPSCTTLALNRDSPYGYVRGRNPPRAVGGWSTVRLLPDVQVRITYHGKIMIVK